MPLFWGSLVVLAAVGLALAAERALTTEQVMDVRPLVGGGEVRVTLFLSPLRSRPWRTLDAFDATGRRTASRALTDSSFPLGSTPTSLLLVEEGSLFALDDTTLEERRRWPAPGPECLAFVQDGEAMRCIWGGAGGPLRGAFYDVTTGANWVQPMGGCFALRVGARLFSVGEAGRGPADELAVDGVERLAPEEAAVCVTDAGVLFRDDAWHLRASTERPPIDVPLPAGALADCAHVDGTLLVSVCPDGPIGPLPAAPMLVQGAEPVPAGSWCQLAAIDSEVGTLRWRLVGWLLRTTLAPAPPGEVWLESYGRIDVSTGERTAR